MRVRLNAIGAGLVAPLSALAASTAQAEIFGGPKPGEIGFLPANTEIADGMFWFHNSILLPVIIGISVYDSFESSEVEQGGIVPMPGTNEEMVGGHCMLAVGYGQKPGYFTVRNSWGGAWGDKGDCYIPEAYLGSTSLGSDYWLINLFGSAAEQTAAAV